MWAQWHVLFCCPGLMDTGPTSFLDLPSVGPELSLLNLNFPAWSIHRAGLPEAEGSLRRVRMGGSSTHLHWVGQVKSTLGPRGAAPELRAGRSSAGRRGGSQCLFSVPRSLGHLKFYINGIIQCHFSMSLNLVFIFLKLFVSIFHVFYITLVYFSSLTFFSCPSIEFDFT